MEEEKKELEALKAELEEAKKAAAKPAEDGRVGELEKEIEQKNARIAELEMATKSQDNVVYMDDKEVEELKKSYEERLEALNEALKKDGAGSKDVMRKRIAAETEKSRKNEEKAKELTRKAKENIFTIKQKDKEIESLKLKLKQVEEENQKAIAALKKQNNAELTKLQKELSEKEMEIEQLKERI